MSGIPFLKGHGTENDFVLLPDLDAALDLTPERVRALCDRQRGLGADGVLRVVRDGGWFMDYRNADGSVAEMCGNGARVFARYLVDAGLESASAFVIGTRAGSRPVEVHPDGDVTVHMGPASLRGESVATVSSVDYPGTAVDVGNPHLVCVLDGGLEELDLTVPPGHDGTVFPRGVNVEFAVPDGPDRVRMRVHERGVGETRSCGTGTVAVAAAVLGGTGKLTVHVPGGTVHVTIDEHGSTLTGPAVFVARGELDQVWWNGI